MYSVIIEDRNESCTELSSRY